MPIHLFQIHTKSRINIIRKALITRPLQYHRLSAHTYKQNFPVYPDKIIYPAHPPIHTNLLFIKQPFRSPRPISHRQINPLPQKSPISRYFALSRVMPAKRLACHALVTLPPSTSIILSLFLRRIARRLANPTPELFLVRRQVADNDSRTRRAAEVCVRFCREISRELAVLYIYIYIHSFRTCVGRER